MALLSHSNQNRTLHSGHYHGTPLYLHCAITKTSAVRADKADTDHSFPFLHKFHGNSKKLLFSSPTHKWPVPFSHGHYRNNTLHFNKQPSVLTGLHLTLAYCSRYVAYVRRAIYGTKWHCIWFNLGQHTVACLNRQLTGEINSSVQRKTISDQHQEFYSKPDISLAQKRSLRGEMSLSSEGHTAVLPDSTAAEQSWEKDMFERQLIDISNRLKHTQKHTHICVCTCVCKLTNTETSPKLPLLTDRLTKLILPFPKWASGLTKLHQIWLR